MAGALTHIKQSVSNYSNIRPTCWAEDFSQIEVTRKKTPTRTTRETSSPLAKSKHRILLVKCPVSRRRKKLCSLLAERESVIHGVSAKCQNKSTPHPFWTPVESLTREQKIKYVVLLKKSDNFPSDVHLRWRSRTSRVKDRVDLRANKGFSSTTSFFRHWYIQCVKKAGP